jgi:hypothetical protein
VLDGRPRHADAEGVMTAADSVRVIVDGHRYVLARTVQVFSTSTLQPVSLVSRLNQYVQVGLRGKTAMWIALYSAVLTLPQQSEVAFHIGTLKSVKDREAVFQDGSVLKVASGVKPTTALPAQYRADIDVARHRVGRLTVVSD